MKHPSAFLCMLSILLAAGAVLRLPHRLVPAPAIAYFALHAFFVFIGWLGLQREDLASPGYLKFYSIVFGAVVLAALVAAIHLLKPHPGPLSACLSFSSAAFAMTICFMAHYYLLDEWAGQVPPQCTLAVVQGGVLFFCGSLALAACFAKLSPELFVVAFGLGGFWLSMALLSWGFALGITRSRGVWLGLNNFAPAFLAIVFFGWMAFQLGGLQGEASLQPIPEAAEVAQ